MRMLALGPVPASKNWEEIRREFRNPASYIGHPAYKGEFPHTGIRERLRHRSQESSREKRAEVHQASRQRAFREEETSTQSSKPGWRERVPVVKLPHQMFKTSSFKSKKAVSEAWAPAQDIVQPVEMPSRKPEEPEPARSPSKISKAKSTKTQQSKWQKTVKMASDAMSVRSLGRDQEGGSERGGKTQSISDAESAFQEHFSTSEDTATLVAEQPEAVASEYVLVAPMAATASGCSATNVAVSSEAEKCS